MSWKFNSAIRKDNVIHVTHTRFFLRVTYMYMILQNFRLHTFSLTKVLINIKPGSVKISIVYPSAEIFCKPSRGAPPESLLYRKCNATQVWTMSPQPSKLIYCFSTLNSFSSYFIDYNFFSFSDNVLILPSGSLTVHKIKYSCCQNNILYEIKNNMISYNEIPTNAYNF